MNKDNIMFKDEKIEQQPSGSKISDQCLDILKRLKNAKDMESKVAPFYTELLQLVKTSPEAAKFVADNFDKFKPFFAEQFNSSPAGISPLILLGIKSGSKQVAVFTGSLLEKGAPYGLPGVFRMLSTDIDAQTLDYFSKNYATFRNSLISALKKPDTGEYAADILFALASKANCEPALKDVKELVLPNPSFAATIAKQLDGLRNSLSLTLQMFHAIADSYVDNMEKKPDKKMPGLREALRNCAENVELAQRMVESKNPRLAALAVDYIGKTHSAQHDELVSEIFAKAETGDSYSYGIANSLIAYGVLPKLSSEDFEKMVNLSVNENGWVFSRLAAQCLRNYDYDTYVRALEIFDFKYESGYLGPLSKIMGIMVAINTIHPEEIGFWDKLALGKAALETCRLAQSIFLSFDTIIAAVQHKPPNKRILEIIKTDGKLLDFFLQSLSNAFSFQDFRRKATGAEAEFLAHKSFDYLVKKMDDKQLGVLTVLLKTKLSDEKTKIGAEYVLKYIHDNLDSPVKEK